MQLVEIKAYVRRARIDSVIHKLRATGVRSLSVIAVDGVGGLVNPTEDRVSLQYASHFSRVYKLELVCRNNDAEAIVRIIQKEGHTGEAGDGVIFVSDIKRAVKIRTGKEGPGVVERATMPDKK